MLTGTGWTVGQLDDTAVAAVFELLEYWRSHPPACITLERIGQALYGSAEPGRADPEREEEWQAALADLDAAQNHLSGGARR